ncbi:MAG: hypothetical protein ACM30G_10690 [Micromonosporaceae bacterium]
MVERAVVRVTQRRSARRWSARASGIGVVLAGALWVAMLGVATAAQAADTNATMTLTPASGGATAQVQATFQVTPNQCASGLVVFKWDGLDLGQPLPLDPNCRVTVTTVPPAGHNQPGTHAICAQLQLNSQLANACANFTIATPTPAATTPAPTSAPPAPSAPAGAGSPSPAAPVPGAELAPPRLGSPRPGPVGDGWMIAVVAGLALGVSVGTAFTLLPRGGDGWSWPRGGVVIAAGLTGLVAGGYLVGITPRPVSVRLDTSRVTQGLNVDIADKAGVFYDGIAGKDTLARADLRITNLGTRKVSATCRARLTTGIAEDASVDAALRVTAATLSTDPDAEQVQVQRGDCWFSGYQLAKPGSWDFSIEVRVGSRPPVVFGLGTRDLQPTGDVRVLVYPMLWPVSDVGPAESHPWIFCGGIAPEKLKTDCPPKAPTPPIRHAFDTDRAAATFNGLAELNRLWPVRSGIGGLDLSGTTPHTPGTPGLRFLFAPIDDSCPTPVSTLPDAYGLRVIQCERRDVAQLMVATLNAKYAAADAADGRHRDRIDQSIVVTPTDPFTTGGQCRGSWVGVEIDGRLDGPAAFVAAQELSHCLGEVAAGSPHAFSTTNTVHSKNSTIPTYTGFGAVNTLDRIDVATALSVLYPSFGGGTRSSQSFMEGWEWNHLRKTLLSKKRPDPTTGTYLVAQTALAAETFVLDGVITAAGRFNLRYAGRDPLALTPTPSQPDGRDELVFFNSLGAAIGTTQLTLVDHDHHAGPTDTPVMVVAELPAGAQTVQLRHDGTWIWSQTLRAGAPTVSAVVATPATDGQHVQLNWRGVVGQRYNVYYRSSPDAAPMLVSLGLVTPSTTVDLGLTPATTHGSFTVRASDGFNIVEAASNEITVAARAPYATITAPAPSAALTEGQPILLRGLGWDTTAGSLDGASLQWGADGQPAGTGASVTVQLTEGDHDIALTATAPSGLSAKTTMRVHVAAATIAALDAAPGAGTVVELGRCPSPQAITAPVGLTTVATASSDATWLHVTPAGGAVAIAADCTDLDRGARYTAHVLATAADGTVRLIGVRLGGDRGLSPGQVLAALGIGVGLVAALGSYLALRRRSTRPAL